MYKNYSAMHANVPFRSEYGSASAKIGERRQVVAAAGIAMNKARIPVNLLKKAQREARYRNEKLPGTKKRQRHKRKSKPDLGCLEHDALVRATEAELKKLLAETDLLSDISFDCTPTELLGEIALARGHETTIYVQREGLSTLTIVLPQEQPTIANLKRAIESSARVQMRRELRERYEERLRRRRRHGTAEANADDVADRVGATTVEALEISRQQQRRIIEGTGELVCSTAYNGHRRHRTNVSWRFLWRAYALFNVDTNLPLNDQDGRRTLAECGIENAATLKFCHREKYFGPKRQ